MRGVSWAFPAPFYCDAEIMASCASSMSGVLALLQEDNFAMKAKCLEVLNVNVDSHFFEVAEEIAAMYVMAVCTPEISL